MAYSSVASHGEAIVRSLLDAGFRVVYRPHPRTGANHRDVAAADAALRAVFESPLARASGSEVVTGTPLTSAFADADALITDVSSLAVEWLPTGRPLVATVPTGPGAVVGTSPLLDAVPTLTAEAAGTAGRLVAERLVDDAEARARQALLEHYLSATGETALGLFLEAFDGLLAERDAARAAARPPRLEVQW
jgi:hypothetical protein